jgi:hypothetical protein
MTENDIRDYIKRKLGDGVVCVELTDDQISDAIERSKLWMRQFIPMVRTFQFTTSEITEFTVPTDCEQVVDTIFQSSSDSIFDAYRWAGIDIGVTDMVAPMPGGGYSELVEKLAYLEMGKRITSAERSWEWDRPRNKLIVSPAPSAGEQVLIYYISKTFDLTYLRAIELGLLQDYALAKAMETLGYIRTKFVELPSSTGGTTLNGDTLLGNAVQMMADLEDKVRKIVPPVPFFGG